MHVLTDHHQARAMLTAVQIRALQQVQGYYVTLGVHWNQTKWQAELSMGTC